MAVATAAALSQAAAGQAFHLFRDKNFRRLAQFDRISQTEQDRVFNELVVTHLVLIMLMCEAPDLKVSIEFRDYIAGLKKRAPQAYVDNLRDLGVEAKHLKDWERNSGTFFTFTLSWKTIFAKYYARMPKDTSNDGSAMVRAYESVRGGNHAFRNCLTNLS